MASIIKSRLNRDDILSACGNKPFQRGEAYYHDGKVLRLKINRQKYEDELSEIVDGISLVAFTAGSGGRKYQQNIDIMALDYEFDIEIDIDGMCTCPVGNNCKHVAAACLKFLEEAPSAKQVLANEAQRNDQQLDSWFKKLHNAVAEQTIVSPPEQGDYLVYLLKPHHMVVDGNRNIKRINLGVEVRATRPQKNGRGFLKGRAISVDSPNISFSSYQWDAQPVDREILIFLKGLERSVYRFDEIQLNGRSGGLALIRMLQTGRTFFQSLEGELITFAQPRKLELSWQQESRDASFTMQMSMESHAHLLTVEPPMYFDETRHEAGLIDCDEMSGAMLDVLVSSPVIPKKQAMYFSQKLRQRFPNLKLPTPVKVAVRLNSGEKIQPCLTLQQRSGESRNFHILSLLFDYAGDTIMPIPLEAVSVFSNDLGIVHVQRNLPVEAAAFESLFDRGFVPCALGSAEIEPLAFIPKAVPKLESAAVWADFLENGIELLRSEGWRIDIDDDFALEFIEGDWEPLINDLDQDEGGNDWFELRFDLDIDGQQIPLAPLLVPILEDDPETLPEIITLALDDGHRYLRLPSERLRPFLTTLRELFDRVSPAEDGGFRLSRFDAILLDDIAGDKKRTKGAKKLRKLAENLRDFSGIKKVTVPKKFGAELRNYQQDGLNWLQFLREYQFNGILADDMGLGKTVQTLAHLLVEKRSKRMKQPTLIVAPTSLMGNWRHEAEQFTPELKVLTLHGDDRHSRFGDIETSDLVLTTYPLLVRDADILLAQQYHYVVLDEAQAIKNSATKMAKIVRELKSNHRLCLTGTPLENHLGELWSLYDFLMPGFLGNLQTFNRCYRVPIEKQGNVEKRSALARRLQPFMLRREKHEVAAELPPKTEILHHVEFGKEQAQFYESIRVAMDKRVREAIKQQGVSRSHITILDALLKLRQVCCDPRLVKLDRAKKVKSSAKLEWLMELLPEQLEEGRRILLFSQFTGMLSLIEDELKQRNIYYTKLTGQTRKRDEAIQRFRDGDVNLFLISLKAGGTGLNLVEADTVIIYDPWWNPAVEAQAIDRAHRIGQDKPVFIYKLVTANSVEEKMLAMQDKKRALAKGIYSESGGDETALLNADTLRDLFSPLS